MSVNKSIGYDFGVGSKSLWVYNKGIYYSYFIRFYINEPTVPHKLLGSCDPTCDKVGRKRSGLQIGQLVSH